MAQEKTREGYIFHEELRIKDRFEEIDYLFYEWMQCLKRKKMFSWSSQEEDFVNAYKLYSAYNEDPFDEPEQCSQMIRIITSILENSKLTKKETKMFNSFKIRFEKIENSFEYLDKNKNQFEIEVSEELQEIEKKDREGKH